MSIRKRVLALAGAGAAALVLGGLGALHSSHTALAGLASTSATGCVNSPSAANIQFATFGAGGPIANPNQLPVAGATTAAGNAALSVTNPTGVITCGTVVQDFNGTDNDGNINTVDGGVFTATVTGPVVILESNGPTFSWNCGATNPPAVLPPAPGGNETCQGGVAALVPPPAPPAAPATPVVSPSQGNTYHVGFQPGTSFGLVGTATPSISTTVVFARFPALGGGAVVSSTAIITVLLPAYVMTLSPSPATIPAALPTSTTAQGSVITAQLYHASTTPCVPISTITGFTTTLICGIGPVNPIVPAGTVALVPGAESGVVTFATSAGIFAAAGASPAGPTVVNPSVGAAQVISVHCGAIPATAPTILIPTIGLTTGLTVTACQTVTATLVGGGAAGTATIVANFVGDFTGATAQAETTVNLAPGPITVPLSTGCNEVITPASLAAGSNGAAVAALATNFSVSSIWVFNNSTHTFQALYFAQAGAPTDISAVGPNQSVFICGTGAGTFRVA